MFSMGMPEILIILAVALLVVGPKKLPDLAKGLGKGLREFRGAADELKSKFEETEAYSDLKDIKSNLTDMAQTVNPKSYLDVDALEVEAAPASAPKPTTESSSASPEDTAATGELASAGEEAVQEPVAAEPTPKRFMPPGALSKPVPAKTDSAPDSQEKPASDKNE